MVWTEMAGEIAELSRDPRCLSRGDGVVVCTVWKALGDMWMYDIPTSTWSDISGSMVGDIPSARMCEMDVVGDLVYLFGGWFEAYRGTARRACGSSCCHVWNLRACMWTGGLSLLVCKHACAVRLIVCLRMAVASSEEYDDFFEFDPASLRWRNISGVAGGTPPQGSRYGTAAGANGHFFVYSGVHLDEGVSCEPTACIGCGHRAGLDWQPDIWRCEVAETQGCARQSGLQWRSSRRTQLGLRRGSTTRTRSQAVRHTECLLPRLRPGTDSTFTVREEVRLRLAC
jgi:hypothetical protein